MPPLFAYMEESMKLCRDCKHCGKYGFGVQASSPQYWECSKQPNTSPVDGSVTHRSCTFMRMSGEPCGPEGELFEAVDA